MRSWYGESLRPPSSGREIESVLYWKYRMFLKDEGGRARLLSLWQCCKVKGHLGGQVNQLYPLLTPASMHDITTSPEQ